MRHNFVIELTSLGARIGCGVVTSSSWWWWCHRGKTICSAFTETTTPSSSSIGKDAHAKSMALHCRNLALDALLYAALSLEGEHLPSCLPEKESSLHAMCLQSRQTNVGVACRTYRWQLYKRSWNDSSPSFWTAQKLAAQFERGRTSNNPKKLKICYLAGIAKISVDYLHRIWQERLNIINLSALCCRVC